MSQVLSQGQIASLKAACDSWQDKYDRLLESHKRLQKVNQGLEDKLLKLVDRCESEKVRLMEDIESLKTSVVNAGHTVNALSTENTRYKNDLNLALQLLQCNPAHYASPKINTIPSEFHQRIQNCDSVQTKTPKTEKKIIKVPISTFPPTAMVYSVDEYKGNDDEDKEEATDVVSASIMAAILKERESERNGKHCPTCTCLVDKRKNETHVFTVHNDMTGSDDRNYKFSSTSEHDMEEGKENDKIYYPFSSDVSVIDVGTQTGRSYIGESDKVTSTCIYCHSLRNVSEMNNSNCDAHMKYGQKYDSGQKGIVNKNSERVLSEDMNYHWDWQMEGQDSGFPSSPVSLTSASLSYESEASCFTSPQDSPGHLSLHSTKSGPQDDSFHPSRSVNIEGKQNLLKDDYMNKYKNNMYNLRSSSSDESKEGTYYNDSILTLPKSGKISINKSSSSNSIDNFTPIHISPSERQNSCTLNFPKSRSIPSLPKINIDFRNKKSDHTVVKHTLSNYESPSGLKDTVACITSDVSRGLLTAL
ncbi:UNVERIFIED_CONTAM: hypothetical protein RMT77_018523 [Armadillidium vulgare]